jgi:hypothetical protein
MPEATTSTANKHHRLTGHNAKCETAQHRCCQDAAHFGINLAVSDQPFFSFLSALVHFSDSSER